MKTDNIDAMKVEYGPNSICVLRLSMPCQKTSNDLVSSHTSMPEIS